MRFICLYLVLALSGCAFVNYDSWGFETKSRMTHKVGEGQVHMKIMATSYDAYNSKNRGPWYLIINMESSSTNSVFLIHDVSITSNEKQFEIVNKTVQPRKIKYTGIGTIWNYKCDKGFEPEYSPNQCLKVKVYLELDGEKQVIEQDFIPKKNEGWARINLLTM